MRSRPTGTLLLGPLLLVIEGCRPDEPHIADTAPDTMPPIGQIAPELPATPAAVDAAVLRREADELDRHVLQLRAHIQTMRQISPMMAGTVMAEHAAHVRAIGERVAAQRATLPVADTDLPALLGMNPDEYRVFLEELRDAADEVAEMQRGDEATVRARLPGHLDRLERLAGQMEQTAAHLRR